MLRRVIINITTPYTAEYDHVNEFLVVSTKLRCQHYLLIILIS